MNNEIFWVGVRFDPSDPFEDGSYLDEQHKAVLKIVSAMSSRSVVYTNGGRIDICRHPVWTMLDIFDATGSRIGFGVRVPEVIRGSAELDIVREWLRCRHVTLHVRLWSWNPSGLPSSVVIPAGVNEMLSVDIA